MGDKADEALQLSREAMSKLQTHEQVCEERNTAFKSQMQNLSAGQKEIKEGVQKLYGRWWAAALGGISVLLGCNGALVYYIFTKLH